MAKIKAIMMTDRELTLLIGLLKILADDMAASNKPELAGPLKDLLVSLHPQDVTPLQA